MSATTFGIGFLFGMVDPAPDLGSEYDIRMSDRDWVIAHHRPSGKNYYIISNSRCPAFPWVLARCIPASCLVHFEETILFSPHLDERAILAEADIAAISQTFAMLARGLSQISLAIQTFGKSPNVLERSMRWHTGHRLPGSHRTRRLRKKRFTAITRWMASLPDSQPSTPSSQLS